MHLPAGPPKRAFTTEPSCNLAANYAVGRGLGFTASHMTIRVAIESTMCHVDRHKHCIHGEQSIHHSDCREVALISGLQDDRQAAPEAH